MRFFRRYGYRFVKGCHWQLAASAATSGQAARDTQMMPVILFLGGLVCSLLLSSTAHAGTPVLAPTPTTSSVQVAAPVLPTTSQQSDAPDKTEARRLSKTLFWSFMILIVFVFAAVAIVMFSRRFRAYLNPESRSHAATPTDDVWAMHQLPDGAIDELDDNPNDDNSEDRPYDN